jgi:hypothetical protein
MSTSLFDRNATAESPRRMRSEEKIDRIIL